MWRPTARCWPRDMGMDRATAQHGNGQRLQSLILTNAWLRNQLIGEHNLLALGKYIFRVNRALRLVGGL